MDEPPVTQVATDFFIPDDGTGKLPQIVVPLLPAEEPVQQIMIPRVTPVPVAPKKSWVECALDWIARDSQARW